MEVIISHASGWSCSNDAKIDIHTDMQRGEGGKIVSSVKTKVIDCFGVFDVVNSVELDSEVDVLTKINDNIVYCTGRVVSVIASRVIINIIGEFNTNYKHIIERVKSWQK